MRIIAILLLTTVFAGTGCELRVDAEPKVVSNGISYDDAMYQERFKQALSAAGIPYKVVIEQQNKETIYWDAAYSSAVEKVQDSLDLPLGRNIRLDEQKQARFKAWLDQRKIPYETTTIDDREYVSWAEEDNAQVRAWEEFPANNDDAPISPRH